MNKRKKELKKLATYGVKQSVRNLKEEEEEDELEKFTMTPYGSKLKYKSGAGTFLLLSHNGKGYFL